MSTRVGDGEDEVEGHPDTSILSIKVLILFTTSRSVSRSVLEHKMFPLLTPGLPFK